MMTLLLFSASLCLPLRPLLTFPWYYPLVQFRDEEIDSDGSDIEARDDVGYESEEDRETAEEKKLRLARLYLQVKHFMSMTLIKWFPIPPLQK